MDCKSLKNNNLWGISVYIITFLIRISLMPLDYRGIK